MVSSKLYVLRAEEHQEDEHPRRGTKSVVRNSRGKGKVPVVTITNWNIVGNSHVTKQPPT